MKRKHYAACHACGHDIVSELPQWACAQCGVEGQPLPVVASRWPMVGGGVAYSVRVPREAAPPYLIDRPPHGGGSYVTQVGEKGRYYFEYHDVLDVAHHDSPQGWDCYAAGELRRKRALARALCILQRVFPETAVLTEFPTLCWANGLPEAARCAKTVRTTE